ncbi:hypothetical protein GCM10028817_32210 [Spirosoma pomorum]
MPEAQTLNINLNRHTYIAGLQQDLARNEVAAEKQEVGDYTVIRKIRLVAIGILGALIAIIIGLSVALYYRTKSHRAQLHHLSILTAQLDDKGQRIDLLNKEIQHRVKNNLQIIYSLLRMQERKSQHAETIESLKIARLRIESIANLHDQFADGKRELSIARFCDDLIPAIITGFTVDKQVITRINTIDRQLPSSQYLPLALMLTEWIVNSIKHASPADGILEINVTFSEIDKQICLQYSDNGHPGYGTSRSGDGLGTDIINLLSRQLDAVLTTQEPNPYYYTLSFSNDR